MLGRLGVGWQCLVGWWASLAERPYFTGVFKVGDKHPSEGLTCGSTATLRCDRQDGDMSRQQPLDDRHDSSAWMTVMTAALG